MFFGRRRAASNPVPLETDEAPARTRLSPQSPSEALKPTLAPPPPAPHPQGAWRHALGVVRPPHVLRRRRDRPRRCGGVHREAGERAGPASGRQGGADPEELRHERHRGAPQARGRRQPDLPVRAPGLPQPPARAAQGGRVPVQGPHQHRGGDRHAHPGQGDPAFADDPGGADERADRPAHPRQRDPLRRDRRDAARGHAPARHLQVRARRDAPAGGQPDAARPARHAQPDLVAPLARPSDQDAAGTRDPRLDRREGDRPRRRARPRRRRLHQPARQAHEAAIRPDHRLRARRRQGHARARAS